MKIPCGGPPPQPRSPARARSCWSFIYGIQQSKTKCSGALIPRAGRRELLHYTRLNEVANVILQDALVPYQRPMNTFRRIKVGPPWGQRARLVFLPACVCHGPRKKGRGAACAVRKWDQGSSSGCHSSRLAGLPQSQGRPKRRKGLHILTQRLCGTGPTAAGGYPPLTMTEGLPGATLSALGPALTY